MSERSNGQNTSKLKEVGPIDPNSVLYRILQWVARVVARRLEEGPAISPDSNGTENRRPK